MGTLGSKRVRTAAVVVFAAALGAAAAAIGPVSAAPGAKPKLALRAVELAPSSAAPGGEFAIAGRVRNRGRRGRAVEVEAFLGGASGPPIVNRRLSVPARSATAFTLAGTVPAGTTPGPKAVTVCVRRAPAGTRRCRTVAEQLTVTSVRGADIPPAPADGDGDGLPDDFDLCPGEAGPASNGGCPEPDGDGDGVADAADMCPATPGLPPSGCPAPQPPSPGSRSLGDPLFPEVGNGGYDVQRYDVNIDWTDTPTESFNPGTATTIHAVATQGLSELSLDLEGLTVNDVEVNGVDASSFTRVAPAACSPQVPAGPCPPTKLVITPAAPIAVGDSFTVEVAYTGDPQRHTDPDGSEEGWTDTADGAFVVNEPVGAMTWMPVNNHPADKAAYDFDLTVPDGKTAIGNGERVPGTPVDNPGPTTTWQWTSEEPIASYLTTATVGDFDFTEGTTPNGMPVYEFIDSGFTILEKATANVQTDRQESVIDYFTVLYGAYPFDSTGTVVDDADVGYALEVQTKSHFPSAAVLPSTLAHEIAHQWFGDSVTLQTWKDIWLNEGWAVWSEWIWSDEEDGSPVTPEQQFDTEYANLANDWSTAPADPTAAGLFDTFPVYTRPAMMLQALREIIGHSRFLTLAREWQDSHRHGNGTTAQFIVLAKQTSGFTGANLTKLDQFFQEWLFGTTKPTITGDNF